MKTIILVAVLAVASITTAQAGCRYVYVNGVAHWVCTYN